MRTVSFLFSLLMSFGVGAASAQSTTERRFAPGELAPAFAGQFACRSPANGACNTAIFLESENGATRRVREVGLIVIADAVSGGFAEYIRGMPLYAEYADVFSELEALRREGGFLYMKSVETATSVYDPDANAWCAQPAPGEGFNEVALFFSNSQSPDTHFDQPVPPELLNGLRAFAAAIYDDPDFRATSNQSAESLASLDATRGLRRTCVWYVGDGDRVTGIRAESEGVALGFLNDPIVMMPLSSDV